MDIIAITPTQQLLWILLAFLLAWMITFTWLAVRRTPETIVEGEERAYYQAAKVVKTPVPVEAAKQAQVIVATQEQTKEVYLEKSIR